MNHQNSCLAGIIIEQVTARDEDGFYLWSVSLLVNGRKFFIKRFNTRTAEDAAAKFAEHLGRSWD